MANESQNLISIQSDLQNPALVTNETLMKYADGSNPQVPSFLALLEMNRRKQITDSSAAVDESNKQTIKDQLTNALTQPKQFTSPSYMPTGIDMGAAPGGQVNPAAMPAGANMTQMPQQVDPTAMPVQAAEGGLMSIPVDHFNANSYAGGGIVAFGDPALNPYETQLVSEPQARGPGRQVLTDAEIMRELERASQTEKEAPVAPAKRATGYEGIRAALPKMEAPVQQSLEELAANRKAAEKLAGVSEDPYADSRKRMSAMEERQGKVNEEAGLNRLIAQLAAFGQADPAKGFAYAGAESVKASQAMEEKQNALRDKQETAQVEFAKAVEKEENARRQKDAEGILAAKKDQQDAMFKFQKAEHDTGMLAAQIYQVQESSDYHNKMASKPTREEFMSNLAKNDPDTYRLVAGQGKAGVLTLEEALKIVNSDKLNMGKSIEERIRMAQEYLDAQTRLQKLGTAGNPAAPAAAADDRPWYQGIFSSSPSAANTMPGDVQKALEKYKK